MSKKRVLLAMSGGVDSSAAMILLQRAGYEVVGATMELYGESDNSARARAAAEKLGAKHYSFDFREKFAESVIKPFCREYLAGLTPNPCIFCNKSLKFSALMEKADELGCDLLATGHYAVIKYDEELKRNILMKDAGNPKDQSYVLYDLTPKQLERVLFPLGGVPKEKARSLAKEYGLAVHDAAESQDICFVPDGNYAAFIEKYTGITPKEGNVADKNGNILGRHKGIINYTIGQRKGLGIAFGKPMYVTGKSAADDIVTVGENEELFTNSLIASEFNRILPYDYGNGLRCAAKTRYNQKERPCAVREINENTVEVVFDSPQRAIAKGQSVVLYDGDRVMGGGKIV